MFSSPWIGARSLRALVVVTIAGLFLGMFATLPSPAVAATQSGDSYTAVSPVRAADTRTGTGVRAGTVGAGQVLAVPVAGRFGIPGDASAAVLNVTVTQPGGGGFITVYPCGTTRPNASNLNYSPGQTVPNAVIAGVGTNGSVCLYASAPTHLIADINGYFPAGADYVTPPGPVTGLRVTGSTASSISLGWTNPSGPDLAAVIVRRSTGTVPPATATSGAAVSLVAPTTATVTDTGLEPDTMYAYAIFVSHGAGIPSVAATVAGRTSPAPMMRPDTVSAGGDHTCALEASGKAWCWGRNGDGQLGVGNMTERGVPTAVAGGRSFKEVSAGGQHTCGLDTTGKAWCWGDNYDGQLGDDTYTDRSVPQAVSGGHAFRQISSGGHRTCAIDNDGFAWCWGTDRVSGDRVGSARVPVLVSDGLAFTHVSVGSAHTCALDIAGKAWCWGYNGWGTLGDGTFTVSFSEYEAGPVAVEGGRTYSSVSANSGTCAIDLAGAAWCWGPYAMIGSLAGHATPHRYSLALPAVEITSGGEASCAIDVAGAAWCWGGGGGALGDGTTGVSPEPVQVAGERSYQRIAAGSTHVCAIDEQAGELWCWGSNSSGQLGDGETTERRVPHPGPGSTRQDSIPPGPVQGFSATGTSYIGDPTRTSASGTLAWSSPADADLSEIIVRRSQGANAPQSPSAGVLVDTTCRPTCEWEQTDQPPAVDTVYSYSVFTKDVFGNLGAPASVTVRTPRAPVLRPETVAAGGFHTCALDMEGKAWCWGSNGAMYSGGSSGPSYVQITAGYSHSCGLDGVGKAWCWGSNDYGQLGAGEGASRWGSGSPVPVAGGREYAQVSAGDRHTCALDTTGNAWCWGYLGSHTYDSLGRWDPDFTEVPVKVPGGRTYEQISSGESHACALDTLGSVWCWGANDGGQHGNGSVSYSQEPLKVDGTRVYSAIAAGGRHTCALDTAGKAWCWGANGEGQLGDATNTNRTAPTAVVGEKQFNSIDAGSNGTCGIDMAGKASCWGANIGDGTTTSRNAPTAVAGVEPLSGIVLGGFHTCAASGTRAWCWGNNYYGQIGDGTGTQRLTPVRIL